MSGFHRHAVRDTWIHLFGIRYADEIECCGTSCRDIAINAGIKESYATEISQGVGLAQYVTVKKAMIAPHLLAADELGIRLEVVNGLTIWEAQPLYKHQKAVERIAQSIRPSPDASECQCVHALDVYVQFPNGLKRPDISVFCREPTETEQETVLTLIPEAVIEVVSKGYEAKDLEIGPSFYLSQGVKDVLVFDPSTLLVLHVRHGHVERKIAPVEVRLRCGCLVTI